MAFVYHCLEQDEQVEVASRQIYLVQHIREIISLDSFTGKCDLPGEAAASSAADRHNKGVTQMPASRRMVLAAGAGLALSQASAPAGAADVDEAVSDLLAQSEAGNAALMRGDLEAYRGLVAFSDDFTLMSPFGGPPSRASDYTEERMQSLGRFFRNGAFEQEVVQAYGSADMVVLAVIERAHVEVGGLPAQDWALRVTLVYRRKGSEWRLAHRHADPLVHGVTLEQAAALGRGAGWLDAASRADAAAASR
jgi:ketosteroid isomerase-like protein